MGLHISFKHPFGKHSLLHQAAPLASLIPGVGPIVAGGLDLATGGNIGSAIKTGLGGLAGKALLGGDGLSGIAGKVGKAISAPNMLGNAAGNLDLSKLIGVAGGVSGLAGQSRQRHSAENQMNASNSQRNALMSKILSGMTNQNYGLPNPNLNQQSSASGY